MSDIGGSVFGEYTIDVLRDMRNKGYGQNGGILVADTTAITGNFTTMVVLEDATFTTLTTEYTKNGTASAALGSDWGTLYAGFVLSGKITACTLASGKVLLVE